MFTYFTLQAYILPHTLICICNSLFKFCVYLNFKAVLALPIMAHSAQTHKSISSIWIVWSTLYVYLCLIQENSIYGGSSWNVVIFRYSVAKGMIYRGKVLTCIKKHHEMVEICHVTEYVCTSWPRNWINIMRQKPWDNFSVLVKVWIAKISKSKKNMIRFFSFGKSCKNTAE